MPLQAGRSAGARLAWTAVRLAGALLLAAVTGSTMAGRRGPVLGVLVFLFYGALLGVGALSFSRLRRWSTEHPVLDPLFLGPLVFFALLLIPALAWWHAALIALAAGLVFVPFTLRRRAARQRSARRPPNSCSDVRRGPLLYRKR